VSTVCSYAVISSHHLVCSYLHSLYICLYNFKFILIHVYEYLNLFNHFLPFAVITYSVLRYITLCVCVLECLPLYLGMCVCQKKLIEKKIRCVCVFVCICMCVYRRIYVCICIYMYIYMCTYYVYSYAYLHAWCCLSGTLLTQVYVCLWLKRYVCESVYVYVHVYVYIYICIDTYT